MAFMPACFMRRLIFETETYMIFDPQGSLNWTPLGNVNGKQSGRACRSDQVDRRNPVQRVDLLVRGQRDRTIGVAHDSQQSLEGGLRDAYRKRLLVKRGNEGIEHRRQQSVDRAVLRIGLCQFIRHLLKGDVGPKTRMLMRKPAMQLNHVVSSSIREETTIDNVKTLS